MPSRVREPPPTTTSRAEVRSVLLDGWLSSSDEEEMPLAPNDYEADGSVSGFDVEIVVISDDE